MGMSLVSFAIYSIPPTQDVLYFHVYVAYILNDVMVRSIISNGKIYKVSHKNKHLKTIINMATLANHFKLIKTFLITNLTYARRIYD